MLWPIEPAPSIRARCPCSSQVSGRTSSSTHRASAWAASRRGKPRPSASNPASAVLAAGRSNMPFKFEITQGGRSVGE